MGSRKVVETYYADINNLADLLTKLVNSYRLLIGGADELNKIALASKGQIKDSLKRVDKLGDLIDEVIDALEESSHSYLEYCYLKSNLIKGRVNEACLITEIQEKLNYKE